MLVLRQVLQFVKNCVWCGVEFETPPRYPSQRFCGKRCSAMATSHAMWVKRDPTLAMPLAERFAHRYVVDASTGCWIWQGPFNGAGYGATVWKDSPEVIASRLSWHLNRGP